MGKYFKSETIISFSYQSRSCPFSRSFNEGLTYPLHVVYHPYFSFILYDNRDENKKKNSFIMIWGEFVKKKINSFIYLFDLCNNSFKKNIREIYQPEVTKTKTKQWEIFIFLMYNGIIIRVIPWSLCPRNIHQNLKKNFFFIDELYAKIIGSTFVVSTVCFVVCLFNNNFFNKVSRVSLKLCICNLWPLLYSFIISFKIF
mgnify:CR=1 FL=1